MSSVCSAMSAVLDPLIDLFHVELNHGRFDAGIVTADFLDELAIARSARIGDDDAVVRALLRAVTGQANFDCHEDELLLLLTFLRAGALPLGSSAKTAIAYDTA